MYIPIKAKLFFYIMNEQTSIDLLHQAILTETRRRLFEDSIQRLKKCLNFLTEAEIWYKPNEQSNSVGNLCLHLCGNARQWLMSGLGGHEDIRQRQLEFDEKGPLASAQLVGMLDQLQVDLEEVLSKVTAEDLIGSYRVQGFEESGFGIVMHVVEHFSYHVGQVTYFVKAHKNLDTGYFEGADLDAKG